VVELLAEDATFAMPPLATWFGPAMRSRSGSPAGQCQAMALARGSDSRQRSARPRLLQLGPAGELLHALRAQRAGFRGDRIKEVTAFITRAAPSPDREVIARMPDHPFDRPSLEAAFENFGLPERLD